MTEFNTQLLYARKRVESEPKFKLLARSSRKIHAHWVMQCFVGALSKRKPHQPRKQFFFLAGACKPVWNSQWFVDYLKFNQLGLFYSQEQHT